MFVIKQAHTPEASPPATPRGSASPRTPIAAPKDGVYEGLPLSSEIICSPRVPSPRFDSNDAGIFHCAHQSEAGQQEADLSVKDLEKVGPASFELLRVVGQGAFGKVCSLWDLCGCSVPMVGGAQGFPKVESADANISHELGCEFLVSCDG